jgi:hypothetical protein
VSLRRRVFDGVRASRSTSHLLVTSIMYVSKLLTILACYALSGFGILLMWVGGMFASTFAGWWQLWLLLWLAAVIAHLWLSVAWLEDRKLGKRASVIAGAAGLGGIFAFPSLLHFSGRQSLEPPQFFSFAAGQLLAVLPALLLAIYLTWYHCRREPRRHVATRKAG